MIGFNENAVVKNPEVSPDVPWAALRSILQAKAKDKIIFKKANLVSFINLKWIVE